MSVQFNGDEAMKQIAEEVGKRLLRAAVYLQTQHKLRLNKSNPRPYLNSSKPGEYPRARTGFGRNSVVYDPTSAGEIAATGSVRVGYLEPAFYMGILETARGRKGLIDTMEELKTQLAKIIG